ncbi:MAG: hypothetical protein ACLFU6_13390 [Candidatus Hydrogenedentota bacterium]
MGLTRWFDEDDLYDNLAWLSQHQAAIEQELFKARRKKGAPPRKPWWTSKTPIFRTLPEPRRRPRSSGSKPSSTHCASWNFTSPGTPKSKKFPRPRPHSQTVLKALGVTLPSYIPTLELRVATKKKLPKNRKTP